MTRLGAFPVEAVMTRTADGLEVRGWLADIAPRRLVLLLAGFRGDSLSNVALAADYARRGWSVLAPDFRATGKSEGDRITFGWLERHDVVAWVEFARARGYTEIGVHGQSLGAAALACSLDERPDDYAFLVVDSCYDEMRNALANRLWFVPGPDVLLAPVDWAGRIGFGFGFDDLRPIDAMPRIRAPVLFVAGDADRKSRPAETRRLLDACASPRKLLRWVRGARHVNLWHFDPVQMSAALDDLFELVEGG